MLPETTSAAVSVIESSEVSMMGAEDGMDDIQLSIMKAQKQTKNKLKKQRKKQKKTEKSTLLQTAEVIEGAENPLMRHILQSFAEEENSSEMLSAIKAVNSSPIVG